jgi:hypothetical protein
MSRIIVRKRILVNPIARGTYSFRDSVQINVGARGGDGLAMSQATARMDD